MGRKTHILFSLAAPHDLAVIEPVLYRLAGDEGLELRLLQPPRSSGGSPKPLTAVKRSAEISRLRAGLTRWDLSIAVGGAAVLGLARKRAGWLCAVFPPDPGDVALETFDRVFVPGPLAKEKLAPSEEPGKEGLRVVEIGLPWLDPLASAAFQKMDVLGGVGLPIDRTTILVAVSPDSSPDPVEALLNDLGAAGWNVLAHIALHHCGRREPSDSRRTEAALLGHRLRAVRYPRFRLIEDVDPAACLGVADLLITNVPEIAGVYSLVDRPMVFSRLGRPDSTATPPPSVEALLGKAVACAEHSEDCLELAKAALAAPDERSESRRVLAGRLFSHAGEAAARAVDEIYRILDRKRPDASP